jgi:hypothetical protein
MARIPSKYEPINVKVSRSGHSKGYVTWGLPHDDSAYYTSRAADGAEVKLGNRRIADQQAAADGDLVALACYGRRP